MLSRREGSALFRRLVLVAFYIEVGLLFMVLPWTVLWQRNYFMEHVPLLDALFNNFFIRGAVSGLGLLNVVAGFSELIPIFAVRARHDVAFGDQAETKVRP